MTIDPSFRKFEHDFWDKTAAPYDSGLGVVTAQTVTRILEQVNLHKAQSILDVACGPGYITRAASGTDLSVTGLDFSSSMIDLARRCFPENSFQVGDAENLPFPENSFDAVCCNFGMMHFADPEKAMQQAYKVCKPGGLYVFTVWEKFENSPGMALIFDALRAHAQDGPKTPEGLPFFFFADEDRAVKPLKNAGFKIVKRHMLALEWPIESAESYVSQLHDGGARIGGILRAQTPQTLEKITGFIRDKLVDSEGKNLYALPVYAIMYTAEKQ